MPTQSIGDRTWDERWLGDGNGEATAVSHLNSNKSLTSISNCHENLIKQTIAVVELDDDLTLAEAGQGD